jgi:hypothetical protein
MTEDWNGVENIRFLFSIQKQSPQTLKKLEEIEGHYGSSMTEIPPVLLFSVVKTVEHPFMPKENGKRSKPVQYQACKSDIPIKIYTSLCIIHLYVCLDFMSRHPTNSLDFT